MENTPVDNLGFQWVGQLAVHLAVGWDVSKELLMVALLENLLGSMWDAKLGYALVDPSAALTE